MTEYNSFDYHSCKWLEIKDSLLLDRNTCPEDIVLPILNGVTKCDIFESRHEPPIKLH